MLHLARRLLKRDPVRFLLQRRAYEKSYAVAPPPMACSDTVRALTEDGICVIENHFNHEAVERIRTEVAGILSELQGGQASADVEASCYPEYGTYVLHHIGKLSPSSLFFINDSMINAVANAYLGDRAVSFDVRAELRSEAKKNILVDDWHTDTWKHRFKAFLYLSDVAEENAPLRYLAGSHTGKNWRVRRFWLDYLRHAVGGSSVNHYVARETASERHNPAFREVVCTGPAGTLILFDTRGIHRGSPLESGHRMVLNQGFVLKDDLSSAH